MSPTRKKEKFKVASVQMDCRLGDKEANLKKGSLLVAEACRAGAELVVLPELFSTGYLVKERDVELAEKIPGATTRELERLAKDRHIHIATTILEHGEARGVVYDTAVFISPAGLEGTYRKIFLWDAERVRFKRGSSFPVLESGLGTVGLQICYEIGFPEGARILTLKGADLLLYPAAFGLPRLYVWDVATRSRALENGVFLVAAGRSGKEDGVEFAGHSRIVSPRGEVLAEAGQPNEVVVAPVDLSLVPRQRREVPYLRDYEKELIAGELGKL